SRVCRRAATARSSYQLRSAHQACNPVATTPRAPGAQIAPHPWTAIGSVTGCKALPDTARQAYVGLFPGTGASAKPFVITAARHAQYATQYANGPDHPVSGNERILHVWSLAKYPTAFFNMSRSVLTLASSRRNCSISSC